MGLCFLLTSLVSLSNLSFPGSKSVFIMLFPLYVRMMWWRLSVARMEYYCRLGISTKPPLDRRWRGPSLRVPWAVQHPMTLSLAIKTYSFSALCNEVSFLATSEASTIWWVYLSLAHFEGHLRDHRPFCFFCRSQALRTPSSIPADKFHMHFRIFELLILFSSVPLLDDNKTVVIALLIQWRSWATSFKKFLIFGLMMLRIIWMRQGLRHQPAKSFSTA